MGYRVAVAGTTGNVGRAMLSILALAGCLAFKASAKEPANLLGFALVDARPDEELKTVDYRTKTRSCMMGLIVPGDLGRGKESPRLERLKLQFAERLGPRLQGKAVSIRRYTLTYDDSKAARKRARSFLAGAIAGPVAALAVAGSTDKSLPHPNCSHEKMKTGWYDVKELKYSTQPLVVEIEATLDGKIYHIDSAYAEQTPFLALDQNKIAERDRMTFAALDAANSRLIELISKGLLP
jgi:hypothetical protein